MLDFIGIGAQKTGSTWLYEVLRTHPQVRFPLGKEIHFWNNRAKRDVSEYLTAFQGDDDVRRGEITPAYALLDRATITEIFELYPRVRLIYGLRNPIDRAWSAALMRLQREVKSLSDVSHAWFVSEFTSDPSMRRGDYEQAIRTWTSVFPAESLKIYFFEEISRSPRDLMIGISEHIGVEPRHFQSIAAGALEKTHFRGVGAPIPKHLKDILADIYSEKIRSLSTFLDIDLSHWIL